MGSFTCRARIALGFLLLCCTLSAWAQVAVPELTRRVTDLTATLDAEQAAALEKRLAAFEAEKGSQIAVLLVPTTQPEDIAQFGIRVADQWKIGRKGVDDGVILIVAKQDRKVRIEVGYGLEGAIPDAMAKRIIEVHIVPRFRQGDFAGGVEIGVDRIMRLIQGEKLPWVSRTVEPWPLAGLSDALRMGNVAGAYVGMVDGDVGAGLQGLAMIAMSALLPAWLVWLITKSVIATIVTFVLSIFALLYGLSRLGSGGAETGRRGRAGYRSGGSFRSGGGFRGGGGGFGGGGASGGW